MEKIAQALGLKADADESTVLAAVEVENQKAKALTQQLSTALAKSDEVSAELAVAITRIAELEETERTATVDKLFADNADRFPVARDEAGALVASALEQSMRALAIKDIDAATAIITTLTVVAPPAELQTSATVEASPKAKSTAAMSPELASQLKQFGLSAEDFEKFNPVNGTHVANWSN